MQIGNTLAGITGRTYLSEANNGKIHSDEETTQYKISSAEAAAILTTTAKNSSQEKTAVLEISLRKDIWLSSDFKFIYKIKYTKDKSDYLSAEIHYNGPNGDPHPANFLYSFQKKRILPLFTEIEKLEKNPEKLQLIKIMRTGTEQIKPVDEK